MNRETQHVVELKEDVTSGELVLEIPQSIISEMRWYEGTVVEWTLDGDEIILRETNDG